MSWTTRAISRLLVYSGVAALFERRRNTGSTPRVTILAYHRIGQPGQGALASDPQLFSATANGFVWQMAYLRAHFSILSFDEMLERHRLGEAFPSNAAIVTFDDGYRDNFDIAYPILRQFSMPATIFLTTGLIGTTDRMWWDEVASLLESTKASSISVPDFGLLPLTTARQRSHAREMLRRHLKALSAPERLDQIEAIRDAVGNGNPSLSVERVHLSWDEVRAMSQYGMTFGAHTHSHPILTQVALEEAEDEIARSKQTIEDELGKPVRYFAYPNGKRGDFDHLTRELLIQSGFEAAVTLQHGSNALADSSLDWLALRRIYIGSDDRATFIAKVSGALELLAHYLPGAIMR